MKKSICLLILSISCLASLLSCNTKIEPPQSTDPEPDPIVTPPDPVEQNDSIIKPVILWIDAEANFNRLRTKSNIKHFLDISQENGFNGFVVDVKPVQGDVLYKSSFLPACTSLAGSTVERDWDYLQFFIDEAHKRKMRVTVSTTILTMGLPQSETGPAYTDEYWNDKCCIEYLPEGLVDIRESTAWDVFAFLNPILPEVKEYVKKMVTEIVTNYDFDGYILDYCRYQNANSDFSEASKLAFEKYAGVKCTDFPKDIYYYKEGITDKTQYTPGKYYNQWMEWRASVIQGYIKDIRKTIKDIKPDVDLEYWAASWWPLPHTGQNWASPKSTAANSYWWATPNYYKTGFADQLDIFQLGSYLETPMDVRMAISNAKSLTKGDCKLYGTISAERAEFKMKEASYACLMDSDGLMVFELSHIIRNSFWDEIKAGVEQAMTELNAKK